MPEQYRRRCNSRVRLPRLHGADGGAACGECAIEQVVSLGAGGDMAAAHSGWALDSPAQRLPRCCFYCTLGKQKWFDAAACESAPDVRSTPHFLHPLCHGGLQLADCSRACRCESAFLSSLSSAADNPIHCGRSCRDGGD
eukprot:1496284-Pleurochrysis_carterae.AAC.1